MTSTGHIVSFIGHHESGKTTLLRQLIPILVGRDLRVGTVKHISGEMDVDKQGKDTYWHRQAGAESSLAISGSSCALFWDNNPDEQIDLMVKRLFSGYDIVLVEGFKHGPFPKIEVYRQTSTTRAGPLAGEIDVVAVVTDRCVALPDGVVILSPYKPEEVADFLFEMFYGTLDKNRKTVMRNG